MENISEGEMATIIIALKLAKIDAHEFRIPALEAEFDALLQKLYTPIAEPAHDLRQS